MGSWQVPAPGSINTTGLRCIAATDLSEPARAAAHAAAVIAQRLGVSLKLVHVIDELGAEAAIAKGQGFLYEDRRTALAAHARALSEELGVAAEPVVVVGDTERAILEYAEQLAASRPRSVATATALRGSLPSTRLARDHRSTCP
ncbi:MAG: universal stress protein, partial [Deltaproteobacteria bacterium]|nr:universal stress protein [Deltaproteobacteria bacterium]